MIRKGTATRQMIIEKSAALFNTAGYSGCSLHDIMKATNLKKGGIYNHFKNKDEIALAAFDYAYGKVLKRFRDRLDQDETSAQKLHSVIEVFGTFVNDPVVRGGCPIGNTAMDTVDTHPQLRKKAKAAINQLKDYIAIKINEGIKRGEIYTEVNAEETAILMVSSLEGALLSSRINGNDQSMQVVMTHMKKLIRDHFIK